MACTNSGGYSDCRCCVPKKVLQPYQRAKTQGCGCTNNRVGTWCDYDAGAPFCGKSCATKPRKYLGKEVCCPADRQGKPYAGNPCGKCCPTKRCGCVKKTQTKVSWMPEPCVKNSCYPVYSDCCSKPKRTNGCGCQKIVNKSVCIIIPTRMMNTNKDRRVEEILSLPFFMYGFKSLGTLKSFRCGTFPP